MKLCYTLLIFIAAIFLNNHSVAQFTISGEYRPRTELRSGYQQLPEKEANPAFFISQRLRISLEYKNEFYTFRVTPQEVRVWGDKKLKSDQSSVGIYEGWVELKLSRTMSLKAGRQELAYDNQRLLSNNNWRQTSQIHDALVMKFNSKGFQFDLGGAFNQAKENSGGTSYDNTTEAYKGNYKTLGFLYGSKKMGRYKPGIMIITDGYQKAGTKATDYYRVTAGPVFAYEGNKAGYTLRAFYQAGRNQAGAIIEAYYLNPEIKYSVSTPLTMAAGLEYISGNDQTDTTDSKSRIFSTLYGSGHLYNGHIDNFTDMPRDTRGAGLVDAYLKTSYKATEKTTFNMDYHYFVLQNNFVYKGENGNITADSYLGSEIDFNIQHVLHKDITLQAGYSIMLGTGTLVQVQDGNRNETGHFAWMALVVKPTLFTNAAK